MRSAMEVQMAEIEVKRAAARIGVGCREVVRSLLRDEEVSEADREFSEVAEQVIRELLAQRGR